MKNLYEMKDVDAITDRLDGLSAQAERQWGRMTPAQAVAHCSIGMQMALGEVTPPRVPIGRLLGWLIKPLALGNDAPMKRNSPTVPAMVMTETHDLNHERGRLKALITRFAAAGPAGCTTAPHPFFGQLTPQEWAVLMYKHLDHHLRQFGA